MSILLYFKSMVCFVLGCFVLGRRGSVLLCLCLLKPLLIFLAAVFPQAVARLPREGFLLSGGGRPAPPQVWTVFVRRAGYNAPQRQLHSYTRHFSRQQPDFYSPLQICLEKIKSAVRARL